MVCMGTSPFLASRLQKHWFQKRRQGLATYLSLSPAASDGQDLKMHKNLGKEEEKGTMLLQ